MAQTEQFEFTYSAPEHSEIQKIREKYLPKEPSKIEKLRLLDKNATKCGTAVSIAQGILYTLLLGLGMSCCLVWQGMLMIPGVIVGSMGMVGMVLTHPIYRHIVKKDREKIAPEILRLSEELMAEV